MHVQGCVADLATEEGLQELIHAVSEVLCTAFMSAGYRCCSQNTGAGRQGVRRATRHSGWAYFPNALRLLASLCGLTHSVYYAVNNVGSNVRKPTVEYSTEDYRHVMSTNLDSTYRLCQVRAAADMVAAVTAPIRRHVVSLTMDAACIPAPGEGRGKASKHHYGGQRGRRADINEERHYIRDDQRYKLAPSLVLSLALH